MGRQALILLWLLTCPLGAQEALRNASRECAICHIRWVEALNDQQETSMNALLERQAGSGDMCLSCHDGSVVDSRFKVWSTSHHTTDAVPSPAVHIPTQTFPLDDQGRMTCATCHTAHAVANSSDLKTVIFLRQPNIDSSLCLACHPAHAQKNDFQHPLGTLETPIPAEILAAGGKSAADGRTMICQTCHEPHGAENDWMLVLPPSRLCITCHADKSPETGSPSGAPMHRIGQTYEGFQPPETLLAERATFGPSQELSCLSCHRLHDASGAKPLLIRKNQDSSLCLECHPGQRGILHSPHDLRDSSPDTLNAKGTNAQISGPCGACHRIHGWARNVPGTPYPHSAGCLECHQSGGPGAPQRPYAAAHPLGIPVPEGKAAGLPLAIGTRELGCLTCHDPHTPRPSTQTSNESDTTPPPRSFLRRPAAQLCGQCHEEKIAATTGPHDPNTWTPSRRQELALGIESGACQVCHQTHGDSPTRSCAHCHDGRIVAIPAVTHHGPNHTDDTAPDCTLCHDPHGGAETVSQLKEAGETLCLSCHEDQANIRGSLHDPRLYLDFTSQGLCLDCHPIHRELHEGNLYRALNATGPQESGCLACHRNNGPAPAVVTPHLHAVSKESPNDRIACISCHNIHQRDPNSLYLKKPRTDASLCLDCHPQTQGLLHSAHDLRQSAPLATNPHGETPDRSGPCGTCHRIHTEDRPPTCTDCHRRDGCAATRVPSRMDHPEVVLYNDPDPNEPETMPTYIESGLRSATGQIVCLTCHEPHAGDQKNRPGPFLRSDTDQQLCADCHGAEAVWRYLFYHQNNRIPR